MYTYAVAFLEIFIAFRKARRDLENWRGLPESICIFIFPSLCDCNIQDQVAYGNADF